ncbi:deoxyribonuclease V [Sphingobacteriales bacterium UPWRP_1]|nr:endonuclease V [Sphingobacteriales bacterium TSM_CSM]PSJ78136.1 deoxyribonuclease V [Sphingobacteriales bacterium UPWRP_1]
MPGASPPFPQNPKDAIALQLQLREQLQFTPFPPERVRLIAGADISFNKFSPEIYAGIVVLSFPGLQIVEQATTVAKADFPYIPGLLSFREMPALLKVWEQLQFKPDVVVLDGHGYAHPRRMGIAAHFGLATNCPALGCGKSVLVGQHGYLAAEKGSFAYLLHNGEKIGAALRTKTGVKPVYISAGHLITLPDALNIMLLCCTRYRIPEPTRQAHLLVNRLRIESGNHKQPK